MVQYHAMLYKSSTIDDKSYTSLPKARLQACKLMRESNVDNARIVTLVKGRTYPDVIEEISKHEDGNYYSMSTKYESTPQRINQKTGSIRKKKKDTPIIKRELEL